MQTTTHNNKARPLGVARPSFLSSGPSIHASYASLLRLFSVVALVISMLVQPSPGSAPATRRTAEALPATGPSVSSQYFSVTGKIVQGDFLKTFNRFGLDRIGYPLSNEQQENGRTVQYFERVRMEYHPELASQGYSVLMTRLGADLTQNSRFNSVPPFASTGVRAYVKETGHSLSEPFLSYWRANGGVELFGYPISEPTTENGLTVQWFERARFEYHPELAKSGQSIELSLLGKTAYEKDVSRQQPQQVQAQQVSQQTTGDQKVAPATAPTQENMENYLFQVITQQRAAAGLQPVQLESTVVSLAHSRSADMAARNYFSHTTPEGVNFLRLLVDRGVSYKYGGEILARNNFPDDQAAQVAMTSYLNSPPHRAVILDGRYNRVGVGYAKSSDGMHYFTVIFIQQ